MAVEPAYRIKNMVPGMIMLWHGAIVDIPSGWHLCDGTMGTPDLSGKFIRAASAVYPPGGIGGSSGHTHDFTGDGHQHDLQAGTIVQVGTGINTLSSIIPAVGTTDYKDSKPPYHQLCYIMKL